jgi:hypothetical protein
VDIVASSLELGNGNGGSKPMRLKALISHLHFERQFVPQYSCPRILSLLQALCATFGYTWIKD